MGMLRINEVNHTHQEAYRGLSEPLFALQTSNISQKGFELQTEGGKAKTFDCGWDSLLGRNSVYRRPSKQRRPETGPATFPNVYVEAWIIFLELPRDQTS
ncbi:hypothetical protein TMatcc_001806 [Talaromyces marneffei ATCC 18224]